MRGVPNPAGLSCPGRWRPERDERNL